MQNMGPMLAMMHAGMSPTTQKILEVVGTPAALAALAGWVHFRQVREPGHFDKLDDECAGHMKIDQAERDHLDGWNNDQKEAMRQLTVVAVDTGSPLKVLWRAFRGKHDRMKVTGDTVEFAQAL